MGGERRLPPDLGRLTYEKMLRAIKTLPVIVEDTMPLPGGVIGLYDEETQTVLVEPRAIYAQKRSALVHELVHWSHADGPCQPSSQSKAEWRAREETARLLVDPVEYRMAEEAYEGDPYLMACEFEVTVQVVKDYQTLLDERKANGLLAAGDQAFDPVDA